MRSRAWMPEGVDLKELRRQEKELEHKLRIVRKLLAMLDAEGVAATTRKRRRRTDTRLSRIVAVLKAEGGPLPIMTIYERLREKDPALTWTQPSSAFRSYLRGQEEGPDEVIRLRHGLYGLAAWAGTETEFTDDEATPST